MTLSKCERCNDQTKTMKAMTGKSCQNAPWLKQTDSHRLRAAHPSKKSRPANFWCATARTCASSRAASTSPRSSWKKWSLATGSRIQRISAKHPPDIWSHLRSGFRCIHWLLWLICIAPGLLHLARDADPRQRQLLGPFV